MRDRFSRLRRNLLWTLVAALVAGPRKAAINTGTEHHTDVGEVLRTTLEDGSRLHLNTDTSVFVSRFSEHRDIFLSRGEVVAEVVHKDSQPFRVIVGRLVVADRGTQFAVHRDGPGTYVSVTRGEVQIFEIRADGELLDPLVGAGSSRRQRVVMKAGDLATTVERSDGTVSVEMKAHDPDEVQRRMEWLRGGVALGGRPLAESVRDLNRYNRVKIVIDDPELGDLRVGGIYRIGDLDDWLLGVKGMHPIDIERSGPEGDSLGTIHLKARGKGRRRGRSR